MRVKCGCLVQCEWGSVQPTMHCVKSSFGVQKKRFKVCGPLLGMLTGAKMDDCDDQEESTDFKLIAEPLKYWKLGSRL